MKVSAAQPTPYCAQASPTSRSWGTRRSSPVLGATLLLGTVLTAAGVAQAQGTGTPSDDSLTYKGITLYGIVDVGMQYENHGAPISDYFSAGANDIVQKDSNHSITGVTPSNLSQSRVGLTGAEPLGFGDWTGVFKLETFFNPQSGEISDGLKSLVQNNGKSVTNQGVNLDSSVAGQAFQQSYAGFASKTYGSLTWGRQNTLFADAVSKYDPQGASQAFSVVGLSGTAAGGGDTQDRRLDDSLKYLLTYSGVHVGAQYKFSQAWGAADTAWEFQLGGEYAGLSVDAYYLKVRDAVSVSALSTAQVTTFAADVSPLCPNCTVGNSLSATISDNTTYAIAGMYALPLPGTPKLYAAYEHIQYANPSTPLAAGTSDIGGYLLAYVNVQSGAKSTFLNDKVLEVYWAGGKYTVADNLDLTVAYYGYHQNSYASGASAGCSSKLVSGACSGTLNGYSFSADYRFTKRFDAYAGLMYTGVLDGLANGYLNVASIDPTVGVRWKL